jgi:hypothetical protein
VDRRETVVTFLSRRWRRMLCVRGFDGPVHPLNSCILPGMLALLEVLCWDGVGSLRF